MRLLHTSDWHLGRTFHGNPTTEALREVLDALVAQVREHRVDAVLISGDIFDHAAPAAALYRVLSDVLRELRDTGATVIAISGNHDSATRLGFQSEWAARAGVHILTDPARMREPVTLFDDHGPVHVIALPYLEPLLVREHVAGPAPRSHGELYARLLPELDAARIERGGRHLILAHVFAVNTAAVTPGSGDTELDPVAENAALARDLTQGGLDLVPAQLFAGFDYAALGHIHGRAVLAPNVRYSGAPLHLSFAEADKPRGSWLIDLGDPGSETGALGEVTWLPLPVPRALVRLTGTLDELLAEERFARHTDAWVQATLTDELRPLDAMRRLRERFPHCAQLEYRPAQRADRDQRSYAERVTEKSDHEILGEFLAHVRNGHGPDDAETELINEVLADTRAASQQKADAS